MGNFHNLVINRRSIRKYKEAEISAESVKTILETALISPTSKNKMPWEFVVVEDKDVLSELSKCKDFGAKGFETCPLAIVVVADPDKTDTWVEDASIASILIQMQAEDCGSGSCWIQIKGRYREDGTPAEEYVRNLLDIPESMRVLCAITLGYKDEVRKPYDLEKCKWEKVHIGKWKTAEE